MGDTGTTQQTAFIERPPPLRIFVKNHILEQIINQRIKPGVHLIETELAQQLDLSRHPIREALQALQAEGWVDLRPGRGAVVHQPTHEEIDEVFEARITVEGGCAGLAALHANSDDIARLRELAESGRRALENQDLQQVVKSNSALHLAIANISGNRPLESFVESLDKRFQWYFTSIVQWRWTASWDEHDEIINAIEAGDSDAARASMSRHAEKSRNNYLEHAHQILGGWGDGQ